MADRNVVIQGLIELHLAGKVGPEAVSAMKQIVAQTKEVEKAVGGFGVGVAKTTEKIGGMEKAFGSFARTATTFFAAGAITNFLRDSYIGFARTERQALAVENQIKSLGQAAEGAGFRDFVAQLSTSSGILDDDLIPAMQRALSAFKDYGTAQDIVTKAAKFAAAGIGDVQSNTEAMARFFQTGAARSLVQFGVNVKGGEAATLDLNEGLTELNKQLALLPANFDDAQSRVNSARVLYDTFADSVANLTDKIAAFALKYSMSPLAMAARGKGAAPAGAGDAAPFGPQATPSQLQFAAEQVRRDADAKKEAAEKALKIETERLAKVAELNEKTDQDILKARIALEEQGSTERLKIELELNERIRAAALKNAEGISKDKINELFDLVAAQKRAEQAAAASGPELGPGAGGEPPEVKAKREATEEILQIEEQRTQRIIELRQMEVQAAVDAARRETDTIIAAGSRTGHALADIFDKTKGFAIGMAIMDTASAIMQIWSDKTLGSYYVKAALTVAMAAEGLAQIQNIRSASMSGGGGVSGGGGGVAANPTRQASGSPGPPPAFTAGGAGIPMSQSQFNAMASSGGAGGGQTVNVHIRNAFGDKRATRKLTREIQRNIRLNQGQLR